MNDSVGLSNILDVEVSWKKPVERLHGKVVEDAVVDVKLLGKVVQGVKVVAGVKAFLVLSVAVVHLASVLRDIGVGQLIADAKISSRFLKQCGTVLFAVVEAVGKFSAVVRLDAFYLDDSASIPFG